MSSTFIKGIDNKVKGFAVGSSEVNKLYLGSTLIYDRNALPYDAEIKYLQSSGTQWIDTGIKLKGTDTVSITYSNIIREYGSHMLFGIYSNTSKYCLNAYDVSTTSGYWYYNNNQSTFTFPRTSDGLIHTANLGNKKLWFDNNTPISLSPSSSFTCMSNCAIFGTLGFNNFYFIKMRCHAFKITDVNGNLLRDMIPVRVYNTGYLYDKVSKTLFGNSGSGSFTLGTDVN